MIQSDTGLVALWLFCNHVMRRDKQRLPFKDVKWTFIKRATLFNTLFWLHTVLLQMLSLERKKKKLCDSFKCHENNSKKCAVIHIWNDCWQPSQENLKGSPPYLP